MSEPVQRQGGMVLRKKEKCYHFYHQRFKLKKKKKKSSNHKHRVRRVEFKSRP